MTHGKHRTPRPAALALLVSSTLLLTGCGEAEPVPKFAPAPSVTPTPAPGAATVDEAAAAKGPPETKPTAVKQETSEEFIRRWNAEQTRMQTGDTAGYREMTPQCEACQKTTTRIDRYYAAGGFVRTKGRKILSIRPSDRSPGQEHAYLVEVDSAPTKYRTSAHAPKETMRGGRSIYEVLLRKQNGEWTFVDYWKVPS